MSNKRFIIQRFRFPKILTCQGFKSFARSGEWDEYKYRFRALFVLYEAVLDNNSLYCLKGYSQYATAKAEHTTKRRVKYDHFIWTEDEVELLLKVCIEYKTSKTNENTD